MCVTLAPAEITGTSTYVYATNLGMGPVHVCGYQNTAITSGPNCMFLNFAGQELSLLHGPEYTHSFMNDLTWSLPELRYVPSFQSKGIYGVVPRGVSVENYGDYTIILAQGPADILSALSEVPEDRRPQYTRQLEDLVNFYMYHYPQDSFVLGCFNGAVRRRHPIAVSYRPRNSSVLTAPGLDGHDGRIPYIGQLMYRDFKVAFGVAGYRGAYRVNYQDSVSGQLWAPESVVGFIDNRTDGPNCDYVVAVDVVIAGLTGVDLAHQLITI